MGQQGMLTDLVTKNGKVILVMNVFKTLTGNNLNTITYINTSTQTR